MKNLGLGGNPRIKDERDYSPDAFGSASPYPDTFASPVSIIYMQDHYPTCGAHAGAEYANILFGIQASPKHLWKNIKKIDSLPAESGTDMRSIFKAMQNPGVCELSLLDNSLEQSLAAYTDPAEITPAMDANAALHRIGLYGFIDTPTMAQIKQIIYTYGAALLLVDCGDGWWLPNWGPINNPLHLGNFVGHHFICATAYGMTLIDGANSWSVQWGNNGMFNFDESYMPHVIELGFATKATTAVQYQFNSNLYFGMTNNADVHALQVRLGMPTQYQTGNFYAKTMAAVMGYQRSAGITATGFVGPLTRAALNKPLSPSP